MSSYRKAGAKEIDANQCELNRRLIQAGHRMLSTSTIQSLVKSIEICRLLGRSRGNPNIAEIESKVSGRTIEARQAQSHHQVQQDDDGPRRPAWANWVTSEILFHRRLFVLPPEPELPFASISLGPQILNVSFVTTSSDSKFIAACSSNGCVAILSNGIELVATLTLHQRAATSCDFSPDSNFLVVSSDDCTVSVWSLIDRLSGRISGRCIRVIKHDGPARLCRYDPEGRLLCTSGSDFIAYLWFTPCWTNEANTPKFSAGDTQPIREHCRETASCMQMLEGHTGHLTTCCWSDSKAGGHAFVTGSIDQTLRIHRKNSAAALWECTECLKFTASISQCFFDISGFMLVLSFHSQKSLLAYDMKSKRTTVIGTDNPNRPK
jgi:WD40 repeat protein